MPTYKVRNPDSAEQAFNNAQAAADALADGGCIIRVFKKHGYLQCDRTWNGGGYTSVRAGYGGLIEEPLSEAKARFLRNEPFFEPCHA